MGYDPIDTDETDSNADTEITVDAINFGSDSTEATYQIQDDDPAGGGDFVIRDTDANLAILSYDQVNDEWDFAATANFNSNSVSGITSLSADSITVDTLDGADIANASADEVLETDGSGGLRLQAGEVTVNGNTISLGGSVTLDAADVGAVDTSDFPTLEDQNGNPIDSANTIVFDTS